MLSFKGLLSAVATVHGVPRTSLSGLAAVASRIRHLNTMSFPPMEPQRPGARFDYGASEIVAVALVFELGRAFVPPAVATRLILDWWPEITTRLAELAPRLDTGRAAPGATMRIWPNGLAELGEGEGDARHSRDKGTFLVTFGEAGIPGRRVDVSVQLDELVAGISSALHTDADRQAFASELVQAPRSISASVRLDGRRGWYWRRAAALVASDAVAAGLMGERLAPTSEDELALAYIRQPLVREADSGRACVPAREEFEFSAGLALLLLETTGNDGGISHSPVGAMRAWMHADHQGGLSALRDALMRFAADRAQEAAVRPDREVRSARRRRARTAAD